MIRSSLLLLLLSTVLAVNAAGGYLRFEEDYGCHTSWGKTANLHVEYQMYLGVNRTNNRIEDAFDRKPMFNFHSSASAGHRGDTAKDHRLLSRTDVDWMTVLAVTFRRPDSTEVGNDDIDYGYNSKLMHLEKLSIDSGPMKLGDLNQPFNEHPFRFSKINVTYSPRSSPIIEVKANCDSVNPRAWISSPGLYRLVIPKNSKQDFYFENMYYWPRMKQILT